MPRGVPRHGLFENKEWLFKQYNTKRRFMKDIAKECGIDTTTLHSWIHKHGIQPRPRGSWDKKGEKASNYIDGRHTYHQRAIEVKGNKCEICGKDNGRMYVHHIKKAEYNGKGHGPTGGNQSIDNLKVLCSKCHYLQHKRPVNYIKESVCLKCGKTFTFKCGSSSGKYCSIGCYLMKRWGYSQPVC